MSVKSIPCRRLAPPWLMWSMVVVSIGAATWLVPDEQQLIGRLIEDGDRQRARELIGQPPMDAVVTAPLIPVHPVDELRLALGEGILPSGTVRPDAGHVIAQMADPSAAHKVITELAPRIDSAKLESLYLAMAQSALAMDKAPLAGEILMAGMKKIPASEAIVKNAVTAMRWCNRPAKALGLLLEWRRGNPERALVGLEVELHRELNRPHSALALITAGLESEQAKGGIKAESITLAIEVAGQAGHMKDVIPFIQAFLASFPEGRVSWQALAARYTVASPEFLKLATMVAQQAEWSGQPDMALDWYLKLAALKNGPALSRIEVLHPGLNRQDDWRAILEVRVPVAGRPLLTRSLARLQAAAGRYDAAAKTYALWLRTNPRDFTAHTELAAMYEETGNNAKALQSLLRAHSLVPGDLQVQKDIADLRIALKDFHLAFAFYHGLAESQHDTATLENYGLLAEALAEYEAHNRALLMRYHRLKIPQPADFLELARSFQVLDRSEGAIAILQEGLLRLPKSRVLRIELAQCHQKAGDLDAARALLANNELKSDMQAMCLFIETSALNEDFKGALTFLGRGFENRFAFPPDVRLDLGHIYYYNGLFADADRLYSSIPNEPSMWPLLAHARFKQSDFAGAEQYQRRYLDTTPVVGPQAWLLMGDILKGLGRDREATGAYEKSLMMMERKLSPPSKEGPANRQASNNNLTRFSTP